MLNYEKLRVTDLGNIENLLKMTDKTICFNKKSNLNPSINGLWINVNNDKYYFKLMKNISYLLNDLLGVKITQYFGLPSVEYKLARGFYKGKEIFGLISKYQREENYQYENLEDIVYSDNSLIETPYDIRNISFLNALEIAYPEELLSKQLKTLIVRDLVTNEKDRKMGEVHIRKNNIDGLVEIDKIYNYENEWNLLDNSNDDIDILELKEEDIDLDYKIIGLLNLTKESLPYIQNDTVIQENLHKFMDLEIPSLLEQVELETNLTLSQSDYDFYSIYSETVKQKLKKEKFLI